MCKPSTNVAILEHELSELRLLLERKTGVLLDTETETLVAVAGEFLESQRLASAEELLARLRASDAECESLAGRLLDGKTGFFRCPAAHESLVKMALPDLLQRRKSDHPRAVRRHIRERNTRTLDQQWQRDADRLQCDRVRQHRERAGLGGPGSFQLRRGLCRSHQQEAALRPI